jgi:hypothetical protein
MTDGSRARLLKEPKLYSILSLRPKKVRVAFTLLIISLCKEARVYLFGLVDVGRNDKAFLETFRESMKLIECEVWLLEHFVRTFKWPADANTTVCFSRRAQTPQSCSQRPFLTMVNDVFVPPLSHRRSDRAAEGIDLRFVHIPDAALGVFVVD